MNETDPRGEDAKRGAEARAFPWCEAARARRETTPCQWVGARGGLARSPSPRGRMEDQRREKRRGPMEGREREIGSGHQRLGSAGGGRAALFTSAPHCHRCSSFSTLKCHSLRDVMRDPPESLASENPSGRWLLSRAGRRQDCKTWSSRPMAKGVSTGWQKPQRDQPMESVRARAGGSVAADAPL